MYRSQQVDNYKAESDFLSAYTGAYNVGCVEGCSLIFWLEEEMISRFQQEPNGIWNNTILENGVRSQNEMRLQI